VLVAAETISTVMGSDIAKNSITTRSSFLSILPPQLSKSPVIGLLLDIVEYLRSRP